MFVWCLSHSYHHSETLGQPVRYLSYYANLTLTNPKIRTVRHQKHATCGAVAAIIIKVIRNPPREDVLDSSTPRPPLPGRQH